MAYFELKALFSTILIIVIFVCIETFICLFVCSRITWQSRFSSTFQSLSIAWYASLPDQVCNSPYCQSYSFYNVGSKNLGFNQLIIPKLIFFLYSYHLSGCHCIDIVRRNSVMVTHWSLRVKSLIICRLPSKEMLNKWKFWGLLHWLMKVKLTGKFSALM